MIFYGRQGDNSLTDGSVKVIRSLSVQKDNLKCKKQGPKSLSSRWQSQASRPNDPLSNSNNSEFYSVSPEC
jgi:hypothetical protein